MSNLSSSTRALLDAAKHDGPTREKRAAIWTGVTGGLITHTPLKIQPQQNAASSGAAAGAAKSAFWAGASMKGAFIGALFGSAISIGVATFMLRAKTEPAHVTQAPATPVVAVMPAANAQAANAQAANVQGANPSNATSSIELPNDMPSSKSSDSADPKSAGNSGVSSSSANSSSGAKTISHESHGAKKESSATNESPDDLLSRETAFVADARRELLTGDPAAALKSVRAARSLEARQFEPQEMRLEARALHALGRDAEAERVESSLRTMYPGR